MKKMAEIRQKMSINTEVMSAIFVIFFVALFILLNLNLGFIWPLYILAAILSFIIPIFFPRSGLFAIIFLTMFFEKFFTLQSLWIGRFEYKLYPLDIVFFGTLAGTFFQIILRRIKINFKKTEWILISFIILNILIFIASVFIFNFDFALAFSTLKNYAFYSMFFFLILFLIEDQEDLKRLFNFFLAGAIAIIIFILIGLFRGEGLWTEFNPLSTVGTRTLGFAHGLYLSLAVFPILIYLIFKENILSIEKKFALYALLFIWGIGIIGTLMRHIWMGILIIFLGIFIFIPKEERANLKKIFSKLTILFIIIFALVFYISSIFPQSHISAYEDSIVGAVFERTTSIANTSGDESLSWRKLVWKGVYESWKTNPIFGIGTGQKIYVETETYKEFIEARNIHNSIFAILIQFGLLGIFIFGYFIFENAKNLIKSEGLRIFKYSILSMLGFYLIIILFQPYLESNMLGIFFWIILGVARILPEISKENN